MEFNLELLYFLDYLCLFHYDLSNICFVKTLFPQVPDSLFMVSFFTPCSQRSVTNWGSSQDAGLQPRQLWAKEVLSEGMYLWSWGPSAMSWHHAAAQRDDGKISSQDGGNTGVRGWEGDQTLLNLQDNIIIYNMAPIKTEWVPLCCVKDHPSTYAVNPAQTSLWNVWISDQVCTWTFITSICNSNSSTHSWIINCEHSNKTYICLWT